MKQAEPEVVVLRPRARKVRPKRHLGLWITLGVVLLLAAVGGYFWQMVSSDLGRSFGGGVLGLLQKEPLKTDSHGRTNVLLFATSGYRPDGSDHDGGSGILTDSIMLISVDQASGDRFTLSVPRDIYVKHGCGRGKINETYACEMRTHKRTEAEAAATLRDKISEITGLEIQYLVHVNFTVVQELVDRVGGIDITIPHDMADVGCKFSYKKGQVVHLNGEQAICFARARNHDGGYGIPSDYERGLNQQRVLKALQQAALADGKLLNPAGALSALDSLGNHLRTNLQTNEVRAAVEILQGSETGQDRGEYTFMDNARQVYLLRGECTVSTAEAPCGANGGQMILVPQGTSDWYDYTKIREYFTQVAAGV